MSARDWSQIGSVMVRAIGGMVTHHATLTDAVKHIGEWQIMRLEHGHLGCYSTYLPRHTAIGGDSHVFYDELGLVIPPWKVKEHASFLPSEAWERRRKSKWRPYARHWKFRQGPVPYVRSRRGSWGGCTRWIRTKQEITENAFLDYDDDALDYGIEARGERRNLRTVWDDPRRHREKNWKRHRRTQYKI